MVESNSEPLIIRKQTLIVKNTKAIKDVYDMEKKVSRSSSLTNCIRRSVRAPMERFSWEAIKIRSRNAL